jgi:hypothetical protein
MVQFFPINSLLSRIGYVTHRTVKLRPISHVQALQSLKAAIVFDRDVTVKVS